MTIDPDGLFDMAVDYYGNGWRPWFASDGSCP